MNAFGSSPINKDLDASIVDALVQMFDESNNLVKIFPMSRDHFIERDIHCLRLCLIGSRTTHGREYNLSTCFEIATIIIGDIGVDNVYHDIIVKLKEGRLHRINELHPSHVKLQYHLLFPYGEDGFMLGILCKNINEIRSDINDFVTMREYYAFRLQECNGEGHTLISSGRLFQQFDVVVYTCIEAIRLMWVKNNQEKLRIKLYIGLNDAIMRGDITPTFTRKKICLTFKLQRNSKVYD